MAEEEVVVVAAAAVSSPSPTDHKRKLEDLEPDAPEQAEPDGAQGADVGDYVANDESEAKRPRLEDQEDDLATENGYQREKEDEVVKENVEELTVENAQSLEAPHPIEEAPHPTEEAPHPTEEAPHPTEEAPEAVNDEQPSTDNEQKEDTQEPSIENPQLENPQQPTEEEFEKPTEEIPQQEVGDVPFAEVQQQPTSETQTMSRKMEVPNNKVGVLIGKAGDTIRFLQYNSGAKIQITRDVDADPYSASRPVELIGTLENINKAEKLIKDVIAEADAGGSPSLVARGFATAQAVGAAEQVQIQVPNEKVGLIIGKGGETIKSLQTRSGARIQLIPQHLPEGDQSKERTVRVTGDKKQIEMAREMIKEVMNQPVRSSTYPGSYNPQGYRPRGPTGPSQWGSRGPHPGQPAGYDYQRGPYPSQNQQYAPPSYGGYPPQQMAPRSSFGSGWEQRPPANMQGPPQSGGYDFYGGQGGHGPDGPAAAPHSASMSIHAPGPSPSPGMGPPPSQGNYNYGQPQGPDYGQQAQYSQTGPPQQGYGHGYDEPKYEGQAPTHPPYGGHGSQPVYPQGGAQSGYPPQQPYGKPQSYGMPSQAPSAQSYGPPRATQPGDVPYQGPMSSNQSYGPNVPPQQYPYASSGPMQQTYPAYASQPAADGYNQPPPASGPGYPQQGAQPMSGYSQPGGQQAQGYAQVGPQGGYGPYPSQPGYAEQQTPNNAAYGYQGPADPTYNSGPASAYGAQPSGQPGYVQPTPTQPSYDQSIPAQSGGYGAVPVTAPVGYGKSLSPQPGYPQYDATQMYGAHR